VSTPTVQPADPFRADDLDRILDETGRGSGAVIAVLQAIQARYRYLPETALRYVCDHSEITPAAIVGVSTFYTQFRLRPAGRHTIRICHGTTCHVKGASAITEALRRFLQVPSGDDTDPERRFTIEKVACLGCCTLAPVMQIDTVTYGHLTTDSVTAAVTDFLNRQRRTGNTTAEPHAAGAGALPEIRIGLGSCCMARGSLEVRDALWRALDSLDIQARVKPVGCVGMCHQTPLLEILRPGEAPGIYAQVKADDVAKILRRHFVPRSLAARLRSAANGLLEQLFTDEAWTPASCRQIDYRDPPIAAFIGPQKPVALEDCGQMDPADIEEYRRHGGFAMLEQCLTRRTPEEVIEIVRASGLRGRGGAGFPTGAKWAAVRAAAGDDKTLILNGDEGDPGAFMDRMLLESYPYRILEGMAVAAYAVGARTGVLYIRHEYPLAVARIREAVARCEQGGFLGEAVCGTGFSLRLQVMEGAGAFVCGEETALIRSIEGERGTPRFRPPYPAQSGLWGLPTLVNNVETYATLTWILKHGAEAFAAMGTERSRGTKVFALAGKVNRLGLIEVPMGITIRRVVDEIGGGIADSRRFKAVQIGGPSGGCIPARLADTPIDYEALVEAGAMMGSGGLVVLDDADCMVEMARYFLGFTQHESCGTCTFCRIGTTRMLEILERLCGGTGKPADLDALERLSAAVKRGSLCGLGKTAPNPVLTTLRYFRDEYEAHAAGVCPAGQCKALITYRITEDCIGCTRCAQQCPVGAIPATPYERHAINPDTCVRCDGCRKVCPAGAVVVISGNRIVKHGHVNH
jgi:NADH-quinone oxidoreductase subunit F